MIVTIDGPAGTGKSTVARGLAHRLGYDYLDTGAMYRAIAFALTRAAIPFDAREQVLRFLRETRLDMRGIKVFLNGEDVSQAIRTPDMSDASSRVAVEAHVREVLVEWQRQIADDRDMVCEGRDQGSVVFPKAPCKFFLTATVTTRARRRHEELITKGCAQSLEEVIREIETRDERDRTRQVGPLVQAADAHVIESDGLSVEEVIGRMEEEVRRCARG
jgi:cytidylate kinase